MRILYQLTSPMDRTMGQGEIARRRGVLQDAAAPDTAVECWPVADGPASIEGAADAALVVPEMLRLAPRWEAFDAVITHGCHSGAARGAEPATHRHVSGMDHPRRQTNRGFRVLARRLRRAGDPRNDGVWTSHHAKTRSVWSISARLSPRASATRFRPRTSFVSSIQRASPSGSPPSAGTSNSDGIMVPCGV